MAMLTVVPVSSIVSVAVRVLRDAVASVASATSMLAAELVAEELVARNVAAT